MRELPQIIKENGFDFHWDNKKVWALNLPVEKLEIKELDWILDLPFWDTDNGYYNLKARDVLNNLDKYQSHKEKIEKIDVSYPIDIMKNSKDKWLILDGLHRLVKLLLEDMKEVDVRKLDRSMITLILKD